MNILTQLLKRINNTLFIISFKYKFLRMKMAKAQAAWNIIAGDGMDRELIQKGN